MTDFQADAFLDHWFGQTREDISCVGERMPWWFSSDEERDRLLQQQYLDACESAMKGGQLGMEDSARERLALILLLDQLPRNLFRGTARAFASDADALKLCLEGNETGQDRELSLIERVFFWMPLQHVENLELQELGVDLYSSLAEEDPDNKELWNGIASYARLHRDIIAKFGRFPHRNAVLSRESTEQEVAYMESGGESFGQ